MIKNLSVIYYTPNYKDETFAEKIRQALLKTIGKTPLISVSQKPLKFGHNICIGDIGRSPRNVYKQMLIGAKEATTDYVGMAEDDTLYHPAHFDSHYLPPLTRFGFNMSRWSICPWLKPPVYSFVPTPCNSNMIAPRKLLIKLIEKRTEMYPDVEVGKLWNEPTKYDEKFGIGKYYVFKFMTAPTVSFTHYESLGFDFLKKRKRIHPFRAYDIPYWGKVSDLLKQYYDGYTR
jgi:hypothetical protein